MSKYVFPAVFSEEDGGKYSVYFPDLEGCYTCGDNLQDAIVMAEDVLAFYLYDEEKAGNSIPSPTDINQVKLSGQEFVSYIVGDTIEYAKLHNNKAVKKTLTIPEWLNEEATAMGVNFSQVLQEALIKKLNIG